MACSTRSSQMWSLQETCLKKSVWGTMRKAEGYGVPTQMQASSFCSRSALVTQDTAWSKGMAPGQGAAWSHRFFLSEEPLDPRRDHNRALKISPNISSSELWTLLASRNPLNGCNFSPVKFLLWQKMWESLQPNTTEKIYQRNLSGNVTERFHLQGSGHDTSLSRENTSHVLLSTQTPGQKMAPLWLKSQGLTWLEGCKCS